MNDILDEFSEDKSSLFKNIYSKLAASSALIQIAGLCYLTVFLPAKIRASEMVEPPIILLLLIMFFSIMGFVTTILSFLKREPSSFYKWFGMICNVFFFIFLISSIIFANLH